MKTDTAQRNIPTGWRTTTIEDVCENLDNLRKPVTKSNREPGDVPYYGATGIVDYVKDYIFDEPLLLIGEDGADWSKFANTAYEIDGKSWVNNHAHVLRCTKAHRTFLKEYLNYADLNSFITGGTRGKLTKGVLSKIPIPLPSSDEQKKIADILGSVNEEIQKTDEIISATEKLKRGLIQKIFTRNSWQKKQVDELFELGRGRVINKKKIQTNPGPYPVYSSQTSNRGEFGRINTFDFDGEYLTWTTDGAYAGAVFYRNGKFNCTNVCGTLKPKVEMDARYFSYVLPICAEKHVVRTANPKLMNNVMARVSVPVPPIDDQRKIAETMWSVDEKVSVNQKLKSKLILLKKGLMQDLLSGKKRTI